VKFCLIPPIFLALTLAGCGSPPPPPVVYKNLDYSYLPPINLKISSITVQNNYVPDPDSATLIGEAPEAPANALADMLNRRLVPNGTPGTGVVTIETASLDQSGGNLSGTLAVRLDVATPDNRATGFTEATVTASQAAPDPDGGQPAMQAALYAITKQLMDAMNVQMQYQIQHNLSAWVSYGMNAAAAPVNGTGNGAIQATPLPDSATIPGPSPAPAPGTPPGTPPVPLLTLPPGAAASTPAPPTPLLVPSPMPAPQTIPPDGSSTLVPPSPPSDSLSP
jgi:adhesin HecA-like repeat protein